MINALKFSTDIKMSFINKENRLLDSYRAKLDLRNKIKFERRFEKQMTPMLSKIVKNAKAQFKAESYKIDTTLWNRVFAKLLSDHYQNVSALFSRNLENQLGVYVGPRNRKIIEDKLIEYFTNEVKKTADELVKATIQNARFAKKVALDKKQEREENQKEMTERELVAVFGNVFRTRLYRRKKTISMTETQKAAEKSKYIEYLVSQSSDTIDDDIPVVSSIKGEKDWYAVLDNVTRESHVIADHTQRNIPIGQAYRVGKSRMMFPGDRSLGASAKEIINCRCISLYKPKKSA